MYLLLVSHLLGRYMILVIFTTLVEPFLIPLPEVVVCSLNKFKPIDTGTAMIVYGDYKLI